MNRHLDGNKDEHQLLKDLDEDDIMDLEEQRDRKIAGQRKRKTKG